MRGIAIEEAARVQIESIESIARQRKNIVETERRREMGIVHEELEKYAREFAITHTTVWGHEWYNSGYPNERGPKGRYYPTKEEAMANTPKDHGDGWEVTRHTLVSVPISTLGTAALFNIMYTIK